MFSAALSWSRRAQPEEDGKVFSAEMTAKVLG